MDDVYGFFLVTGIIVSAFTFQNVKVCQGKQLQTFDPFLGGRFL